MQRTAAMIGLLGVIVGSSWVSAEMGLIGDPQNGKQIYEQHCQRCHGPNLRGDGQESKYLVVPPADLQSMEVRAQSDTELFMKIKHGVIFSPMHGWGDRLGDQGIQDVLSYIRMIAPFSPVT